MKPTSYEDELKRTGALAFAVKGVSMRPLIKAGRDVAVVHATQAPLDRFDVGFFKRDNGDYVLHRVLERTEDGYLFCGDSQTFTEAVREDQVLGRMEGLVRNGAAVKLDGPAYRTYVALWCGLLPARMFLLKVLHALGIWVPAKA